MGKIVIDEFFEKLRFERNGFTSAFYHNDGWWVRCSAQMWGDVSVFFMDGSRAGWNGPSDEQLRIPGESV